MFSPCHHGMTYKERKELIARFNALQIQAVAFDFDGVLADSVAIKDEALVRLVEMEAPGKGKAAAELWNRTRGMYRRERIGKVFCEVMNLELDETSLDGRVERYRQMVHQGTLEAAPIRGSLEYLRGWPLIPSYIVSAAPQQEVIEVARHRDLFRYFRDIFGGPTPKEEVLARLIQREGCEPRELLFIGDSDSDHRAARVAGASFLGVVGVGQLNPFPSHVRTVPDLSGLQQVIADWWKDEEQGSAAH
ncbi:MAG: HAD family hydrolase [Magnetococcales bacterium]|nr:HAD family hydrolase [Magnetococcales bacterium]